MNLEIIMGLFLVKHFIFDWLLQTKYQWSNKGNWKHFGGYLHAGINVWGSIIVFLICDIYIATPLIGLLLLGEFVSHYAMDWTKMNINAKMGWGPTTHEQFWWLTGFDQLVHLSYLLFMVSMI